jgi:hypothetical protein
MATSDPAKVENKLPNLEVKNQASTVPLGGGGIPKVIRIQPIASGEKRLEHSTTTDNNKNYLLAAKTIEPAVDNFVGILNGAAVKLVAISADAILEDSDAATELAKKIEWSEASRQGLKQSGARIIARRWPDAEFMDWAVVSGAMVEMAGGLAMVAKELIAIRKLKIKAAKQNESQN